MNPRQKTLSREATQDTAKADATPGNPAPTRKIREICKKNDCYYPL